jgi:transposase
MGEVSTIGVDIAKSVFQIHGVDADGTVVIRKRVGRARVLEFFADLPPCRVGMEACATAHQWARELRKLGHDARLMPPTYVKAYVKRGKNDAADAAAICEAVTRPSMRFVPIKNVEQQSVLMLHRTRDLLIRQRTQLINAAIWGEPAVASAGGPGRVKLTSYRGCHRQYASRHIRSPVYPSAAHRRPFPSTTGYFPRKPLPPRRH